MLFSRDWIAQYVDAPEAEELAAGLTEVGLAVEGIEAHGDDSILDVEVTANRPDCMNHFGIAREVAAKFELPLRAPQVEQPEVGSLDVDISIEDFADCPRYVGVVVEGITVAPSPEWLQQRLEAIGQRPINNIVDVTNFVLWELGQPLHAFDLDRIDGGIRVGRGRQGELLTTLDGVDRKLNSEVLVIADHGQAVALAGIMGGADSEVNAETTNVFIESAHFEPTLVRRGSSALGMHTDASHRFERGADPAGCVKAAQRAAQLMAELGGGTVKRGINDVHDPARSWIAVGRLDPDRLSRFAGVDIAPDTAEEILDRLGYRIREHGSSWTVEVPTWRYYDREALRSEQPEPEVWPADLYEEVLRVVGLEAIPATLPRLSDPDQGQALRFDRNQTVRAKLSGAGFLEALSFSFESADLNQMFSALVGDSDVVEVRNPVSEAYRWMRVSLLPGLVAAAEFNLRRGAQSVELFEIGRSFSVGGETDLVGIVAGGLPGSEWDRAREWDFYRLKGYVETLLPREMSFREVALPGFLDGSAAHVVDDHGVVVGQMGQVVTSEAAPLFAVELKVEALRGSGDKEVVAPSRHPAVTADITLSHALDLSWSELANELESHRPQELVAYGLKDRYLGDGVPEGAVNTTIWFRYNADERSLTQDEVNGFQETIRRRLEEEFGWRKRATKS